VPSTEAYINHETVDLGPKTQLNTLPEESEFGSPKPDGDSNIIAPIPKAAPAQFLNGNHDFEDGGPSAGDEVMKATLTDVQKAIEQLGRNHGDNDGDRSFSFASTQDDRDTDTDFDLSDLDGADNGEDVEGWHRGARLKLAEKARRAVEEAEKLEAMMGGLGSNSERRTVAPPIEVELSDESEDEMDREGFSNRIPAFQRIPEEDENDLDTDGDALSSRGQNAIGTGTPVPHVMPPPGDDTAASLVLPEKDETQVQTATATRTSFPESSPAVADSSSVTQSTQSPEPLLSARSSGPTSTHTGQGVKPGSPLPFPAVNPEHVRASTPLRESASPAPPPLVAAATTSPVSVPRTMSPPTVQSKHASVASANSQRNSTHATIPAPTPEPTSPLPPIPGSVPTPVYSIQPTISSTTATTVMTTATVTAANTATPLASPPPSAMLPAPVPSSGSATEEKEKKSHPSEWTLEEVVDWLKSKSFDQDVCDKFIGGLFVDYYYELFTDKRSLTRCRTRDHR
jgi:hypothetical protein